MVSKEIYGLWTAHNLVYTMWEEVKKTALIDPKICFHAYNLSVGPHNPTIPFFHTFLATILKSR